MNTRRAFSLIEILIAMSIGLMAIGAVIVSSFGSQSLILGGEVNAEAVTKAQQLIEQSQALARLDFGLVNSIASTTDGIYEKSVTVTTMPDYVTKLVTVFIAWTGDKGQKLYTKIQSLVTDLDNVNSPNTCNSGMTNPTGWQNPVDTNFDFQQVLYGNNGNGLALSDIATLNKKIYVTASLPPNNPNDSQTFFVLDISNTSQPPQILGMVDNNTGSDDGMNAVTLESTANKIYAFVANAHDRNFYTCSAVGPSCSQLQVIDATTASAPVVVANIKLATSSAPYVWGNNPTSNGQAVGKSILYKNNYVYLGLSTTQNGPGFHIFDVSNPMAPVLVGSWPTPTPGFGPSGAPINAITVKGKYAYLAHPNGLVGATNEQVTVLDISNPAAPVRVSGYSYAGGVGGNGKSVSVVGNSLYLGRTASNISGGPDTIPEFYILNNVNPASIPSTVIGSTTLSTSESINTLVIRDYLAFLLTTTEFKVINISNPASITSWGSLPLPGDGGAAFDCDDDRFFVIHDVNKDHVSVVTPGAPFTYTLSNTGNITVNPGSAGATTLTRTVVSGTGSVTLSVTGLPSGATVSSITNNPCTVTCSSVITISTTAGTLAGTYPITVTGSPGGTTNPSTTFNLVVNGFDYSLSNSGNITVVQGASGNNTITRTYTSGAASAVTLSASGLPAGATASFATNPCTPTCASVLTITTLASTPAGTYPITVTGLPNGSSNPSTTFNLIVNAPFDYSLSNSLGGGTITVPRKTSGNLTISRNLLSGATQPVNVVVTSPSPLPNQLTVAFTNQNTNPATVCSGTCISTLTITTKQATPLGTYTFVVTGLSVGTPNKTTTFTVTVTP